MSGLRLRCKNAIGAVQVLAFGKTGPWSSRVARP